MISFKNLNIEYNIFIFYKFCPSVHQGRIFLFDFVLEAEIFKVQSQDKINQQSTGSSPDAYFCLGDDLVPIKPMTT